MSRRTEGTIDGVGDRIDKFTDVRRNIVILRKVSSMHDDHQMQILTSSQKL